MSQFLIDVYLDKSPFSRTTYEILKYELNSDLVAFRLNPSSSMPDLILCIGKDISYFNNIYCFYKDKIKIVFLDLNLFIDTTKISIPNVNYIICANLKIKNYYISLGVLQENIFVCGLPIFDAIKLTCTTNSSSNMVFFNYDAKLFKEDQVELLCDLLNNSSISCVILNNSDATKITNNILNWKTIKTAIIKKRLRIVTADYRLYSYLLGCNLCISGEHDLLIYSVLMSKPTVILANTEDSRKYGLINYKNYLIGSDSKLNLTEEALQYYLINFLPCIFDDKNSQRIIAILMFLLQIQKEYQNLYSTLYYSLLDSFLSKYPQLSDPMYFLKEEAYAFFNGRTKLF